MQFWASKWYNKRLKQTLHIGPDLLICENRVCAAAGRGQEDRKQRERRADTWTDGALKECSRRPVLLYRALFYRFACATEAEEKRESSLAQSTAVMWGSSAALTAEAIIVTLLQAETSSNGQAHTYIVTIHHSMSPARLSSAQHPTPCLLSPLI